MRIRSRGSKDSGVSQGRIVVIDVKPLLESYLAVTWLTGMRVGEAAKALAVGAFSG